MVERRLLTLEGSSVFWRALGRLRRDEFDGQRIPFLLTSLCNVLTWVIIIPRCFAWATRVRSGFPSGCHSKWSFFRSLKVVPPEKRRA